MKGVLILLLVLGLAVPASAQSLAAALDKEAARLSDDQRGYWVDQPVKNPTLVWFGLGLATVGTLVLIGSLTVWQQSDLSEEDPSVRLNLHLAPCRTDPSDTELPIADCRPNYGLLATGISLQAAGAALVIYGARPVQRSPTLKFSVRF